jgi:hypothetical protein
MEELFNTAATNARIFGLDKPGHLVCALATKRTATAKIGVVIRQCRLDCGIEPDPMFLEAGIVALRGEDCGLQCLCARSTENIPLLVAVEQKGAYVLTEILTESERRNTTQQIASDV